MHSLHHYPSSSSDDDEQSHNNNNSTEHPDCSTNNKSPQLPPPEVLEATDIQLSQQKQRHPENVSLPVVTPVQEKVEQYLVHVFLPLDHPKLTAFASNLLGQARLRMVGKPLKASFTPLTDFHISISRPVVIRSEQIHLLVKQIRKAVSQCQERHVTIEQKLVAFHSKNQRRLFVAAPLATPACDSDDFVLSLIGIVSKVFTNNGLVPFFDDPRPHVSFAWTETVDVSPLFAPVGSDDDIEGSLSVPVHNVSCTIGKSRYIFPLLQPQGHCK